MSNNKPGYQDQSDYIDISSYADKVDISSYATQRGQRYADGGQNNRRQNAPRGRKKKKTSAFVIFVRIFLVIVLLFAGFMAYKTLNVYHKEDQAFENLAERVDKADNPDDPLAKYRELYDANNDFYGWLEIDDTEIDYPVMYTPDDPEKYLHMDFEGNYSESGVLFIDGECQPDGKHYIIYGHHMFNGSMFGNLPKYEKQDYYEDHKYIKFDTLTEEGLYEIFAVFYSKDYSKSETGVFKYYNYKELKSDRVFNEFVYSAREASIYDTGIVPTFGDEILTLSTCNYHTEDGRFVVTARRIK